MEKQPAPPPGGGGGTKMKISSKLNLLPISGVPVTNNMMRATITDEAAIAIRLIAKADFTKIQCVNSKDAKLISDRLSNFLLVRSQKQFNQFMQYYHLNSLVDSDYFGEINTIFSETHKFNNGICITVI